eukprot:989790-Prymnesium_polylepis.1
MSRGLVRARQVRSTRGSALADLVGDVDEVGVVAVEANHVAVPVADRVDVDAVVDLAAEADDRRDAALGDVRDCRVRCVMRMMLAEAVSGFFSFFIA